MPARLTAAHQSTTPRIVVLDDDPTGSQTVHGCLLLTRWDTDTLHEGLADPAPLFFVLTNTRAMTREHATEVTREVCRNLRTILPAPVGPGGRPLLIISRSDSTLRGHYPAETDAIADELGPFDAHFLVPAFFEGGRFTRDGIHYVDTPDGPIPAHRTPFARDSVFGYSTSVLAEYVEEKTEGRVCAGDVLVIERGQSETALTQTLTGLQNNTCCVVNAEEQSDLDLFARACTAAMVAGKRFLFRSAASLITSFAQLPAQPVPPEQMYRYVPSGRLGVVIVGSHVPLSSLQLSHLLRERAARVHPVVIDVELLPASEDSVTASARASVRAALQRGRYPVVYTSRTERTFEDSEKQLAFGGVVSRVLMDVVRDLPVDVGFIISKGGITSNEMLGSGLNLTRARVVGQILPGCSVVLTPDSHRLGTIPVVIFPGNVGGENSLTTVFDRLSRAGGD